MDTLTHAISGAVIGAATARRGDAGELHRRALWGALFAAFPDSDVVLLFFTDELTYLNAHRGFTHSVLLLPLWATLLGAFGARFSRAPWRNMAALAAATLAAHIFGDLITSYGTKIFAPLYDAPLAFPITFIIDPVFTAILSTGLAVAVWRRRPAYAAASGVALLAYLSMQVLLHNRAQNVGVEYAAEKYGSLAVALPQPLSPFNWKIVVVTADAYHRAYVNLLARTPRAAASEDAGTLARLRAAYQPRTELRWQAYPRWPADPEYRALAQAAWSRPEFAGFREFALLPYVTSIRGDAAGVCVWFTDLRFTLPGLQHPFEYAMCRDRVGAWRLQFPPER